jgi:putative ABC transport system ATP-binding protein
LSAAGLIITEQATKVYNTGMPDETMALEKASVIIERGQVTAIKGPSGSGKSTLLSLIGCMARPTSGRVVVDGRDVAKLPERFLTETRRRTFGFIFQQLNLLRDATALENVALPLYPTNISFGEVRIRARDLLVRFGLPTRINLKVRKLSGGEQQRVAIARALVNHPEIIIADEPTAHLDRGLSMEFLGILEELKEEGKTIVIATHDPIIHEHPMVDRRVEMSDGRIVDQGPE